MNYSVYDEDGECIFEFCTHGVAMELVMEELEKMKGRLGASSPIPGPLEPKASIYVTLH